jgi:hypothetical protein
MSEYTVGSFYLYTVDKYIKLFDNFYATTIDNKKYKCNIDYILFEFTPLERLYYQRNKKFSKYLSNQLNKIFDNKKEYFFKLSNRSPKDILEKGELEILEDDHRTITA